ncbi:MAG: hypothetical protein FJX59_00090 [Alphaproteobacteria bacterium]|nr:hypothetical protein [Alphaproteobacteria bacterium]
MSRAIKIVAAAGLAWTAPISAQDSLQDFVWSTRISTSLDYSSGKYGAATPTDIIYLPVTVQSNRGAWTLKASGAWMEVDGPALILDGGGGGGSLGAGIDRKVNGVGDLNVSATYALDQFYDSGTYIDFTARAKLPTASFTKGLGTGRADVTMQVDASVSVGDLLPFAGVGYKFNGSRAALVLRDTIFASAGLQYMWDERVATGIAFDYRQSSIAGLSDPQEGSTYLSVKLTDRLSLNIYGVVGFSSNSPTAGGGLVFTYRPDLGIIPVPK